jgi:hypothetical protein
MKKKAPSLVREYVQSLSDSDLSHIIQKTTQRLGGDYVDMAYTFQKNRDVDDWLRGARSANDWFDMVDLIGETAGRESRYRDELKVTH